MNKAQEVFTKYALSQGALTAAGAGVMTGIGYLGFRSKRKGESTGKGQAKAVGLGAAWGATAAGIGGKTMTKTLMKDPKTFEIGANLASKFSTPRGKALAMAGGALIGVTGAPIYHGLGRLFGKKKKDK